MAIIDIQDRQKEILKQLNDEFTSKYILYLKTDIAKQEQLEESFKNVLEKFGQIDVIVNTAGVFNDKDVNLTLTVNAVSYWFFFLNIFFERTYQFRVV